MVVAESGAGRFSKRRDGGKGETRGVPQRRGYLYNARSVVYTTTPTERYGWKSNTQGIGGVSTIAED